MDRGAWLQSIGLQMPDTTKYVCTYLWACSFFNHLNTKLFTYLVAVFRGTLFVPSSFSYNLPI